MSKYRSSLPQLNGKTVLTDGGLETVMVFQEGVDLPEFAAFHLLQTAEGRARLESYFDPYIEIARKAETGLLLESVTWRASADWGEKLGLAADEIVDINRDAIEFLEGIRDRHETPATPMVISGCLGPRGDGYDPGELMTAADAEAYHLHQISALADTAADMISALTMTNAAEAIGVACAAQAADIPVAISFTVETDGRLPTGQALADAVAEVDDATGAYPAYFMINCAHPTHFGSVLTGIDRIRGLRANASSCSHEELDNAKELDDGNPVELGTQFADLLRDHAHLSVVGGCCGTDHRHIEQIGKAVMAAA
jgi:S-methylmethionine-dependent homocysteine/selenocysteine methylase